MSDNNDYQLVKLRKGSSKYCCRFMQQKGKNSYL